MNEIDILKAGGFIAGGYACYRCGITDTYTDVDFFFPNELTLYKIVRDHIKLLLLSAQIKRTDYSIEISKNKACIFSLIFGQFGSVEEVLKSFDIPLVRMAMIYDSNYSSAQKFIVMSNKYPSINMGLSEHQANKTFHRILKYFRRVKGNKYLDSLTESMNQLITYYGRIIKPNKQIPVAIGYTQKRTVQKTKKVYNNVTKILTGDNSPIESLEKCSTTLAKTKKVWDVDFDFDDNKTSNSKCKHKNKKLYVSPMGEKNNYNYCDDCGEKLP